MLYTFIHRIMTIKSIDSNQLKQKLDQKEDIVLIDCREINEWNEGHIPEAQHIPLSGFGESLEKIKDKEVEIILQCRSGGRSLQACLFLQGEGYHNLTNVEDGILGWIKNGHHISNGLSD